MYALFLCLRIHWLSNPSLKIWQTTAEINQNDLPAVYLEPFT